MQDTRTPAQLRYSFTLIALPLIALTSLAGWYFFTQFHARPSSAETIEARISVLKETLKISDTPELHFELADLYYQLGQQWRHADPPERMQAAEVLLEAMRHRPDLQGGWPYQAIGDLLQTAGADRSLIYSTYQSLTQARAPGAAVRGHEALAIMDLADRNPDGYAHAFIASRYGHWSESCRQAVLDGPETETPDALWCRSVALLNSPVIAPEQKTAAKELLERYRQIRPWDDAVRFYLQEPIPIPSELEFAQAFPSLSTQPMTTPELPPGTELRWPIYAASECILTVQAEPLETEKAARLEIWLDEKNAGSFSINTRGSFTTAPIAPGHHIVDVVVVPNGSNGLRLIQLTLDRL